MLKFQFDATDRWGYYQAGPLKTYKKIDAMRYHQVSGHFPDWVFNNDLFSQHDWTCEPDKTLEQLYKERALAIREKYEYVILMLSGGADSFNVAESFFNNNIHVDEILIYTTYKGNKNKHTFNDAEVTDVAIPLAKKYINKSPTTKLNIVDTTDLLLKRWGDETFIENFVFNQSGDFISFSPMMQSPWDLDTRYTDMMLQGINLVFVKGVEKPKLFQEHGRWAFRFQDMFDGSTQIGKDVPIEFFYWSPDAAQLLIKQAHLIKNFCNNHYQHSEFIFSKLHPWAHSNMNGVVRFEKFNKTYYLSTNGLISIIYPTWDLNTLTVGKIVYKYYTPRASWLWNQPDDVPVTKNVFNALNSVWDNIPEYWRNDSMDTSSIPSHMKNSKLHTEWNLRGVKSNWSPSYFLEN